jgi:hypothetical protein
MLGAKPVMKSDLDRVESIIKGLKIDQDVVMDVFKAVRGCVSLCVVQVPRRGGYDMMGLDDSFGLGTNTSCLMLAQSPPASCGLRLYVEVVANDTTQSLSSSRGHTITPQVTRDRLKSYVQQALKERGTNGDRKVGGC